MRSILIHGTFLVDAFVRGAHNGQEGIALEGRPDTDPPLKGRSRWKEAPRARLWHPSPRPLGRVVSGVECSGLPPKSPFPSPKSAESSHAVKAMACAAFLIPANPLRPGTPHSVGHCVLLRPFETLPLNLLRHSPLARRVHHAPPGTLRFPSLVFLECRTLLTLARACPSFPIGCSLSPWLGRLWHRCVFILPCARCIPTSLVGYGCGVVAGHMATKASWAVVKEEGDGCASPGSEPRTSLPTSPELAISYLRNILLSSNS